MSTKFSFLSSAENRASFFNRIAQYYPKSDSRYREVERAYNFAKDAFRGRFRDGGKERYFEHIRAVTLFLIVYVRVTDHRLIIAALLHDIVEDIPSWTIERVRTEFGDYVATLVDYLSKPSKKEFPSKEERDRVYHCRFCFAPREFFLIKLCDRLHNLITLGTCTEEKRRRKIEETRSYYLPYATTHFILLHEIEDAIANLENGVLR